MAEIINGVAFCNEETLVIHENESKILYQDLEQKIKNLAIKLENNSSLEILLFNSNANLKCELNENAKLVIYNIAFTRDDYIFDLNVDLKNQYADVHIINLYLGINDSKLNSNVMINHYSKNTKTLLDTYAIAKHQSHLTLNNNAYIKNGMKNSDGMITSITSKTDQSEQ